MCLFIVWYPLSSADFTIYILGIGTLSYNLITSGKNSAFVDFDAAVANGYKLAFSFHQVYPSLLGGQRRNVMRALPNTSTHGRQRDSDTCHPTPSKY